MILENTVPNPKSVAPKLQKLQSRKVSINVGRHRQRRQRRRRHQSGKNYSLVEMKFRRDKNGTIQYSPESLNLFSSIF